MSIRLALIVSPLLTLLAVLLACGDSGDLILATTTTTRDSGLVDVLIPAFEEASGLNVKPIALSSGQVLALGERGEADVLLVHSPEAEERFMAAGHGIDRRPVMHNDFVIVGPPDDPAGIRGLSTAGEAFARIAETGSRFLSRGDESGTHAREKRVWEQSGIEPLGESWYQETGQGMALSLTIAFHKRAYTLSDRGTYLSLRPRIDLEILVEGDPSLLNRYHVILVDPEKSGNINAEAARAFADFITSPEGQEIIRSFGVEEYGQPSFIPDALAAPGSGY